jgi:hypothetical protein
VIFAKPMTLSGSCGSCGRHLDQSAAVSFIFNESDTKDDCGEWICTRCAKRLARWLTDAAEQALQLTKAGLVQRNDEWVPKQAKVSGAPVVEHAPSCTVATTCADCDVDIVVTLPLNETLLWSVCRDCGGN